MRFLNYLNETMYSGEYYMLSPVHFNVKKIYYSDFIDGKNGQRGKYVSFIEFNKNLLTLYKRNLGKNTSMDPKYNFIYSIKGVNCLDLKNEKEVQKALDKGYFTSDFSMEKFNSYESRFSYVKNKLTVEFFNEYEGVKSSDTTIKIAIFEDGSNIGPLKKMKLVDGNRIKIWHW